MYLKALITVISIFILIYLLGPRINESVFSPRIGNKFREIKITEVDSLVKKNNANPLIKPGNHSKLHWADSAGKKTAYVLLYLHGFSASPVEGSPVYQEFAKKYKMNAYAPLLAEHGLNEKEAMLNFTARKYLNSAKKALRIAQALGDSVIIMSTSTGSTAALFLSSVKNDIHSLICYSPNIRVADTRAALLTGPWGLQIGRLVKGGKYHSWEAPKKAKLYWHTKYRLESVLELQYLLESTMNNDIFSRITVPIFVTYYFEDEEHQDKVVSVNKILDMTKKLGTSSKNLRVVNIKDAKAHAMANWIFNENTESVLNETYKFANEVLFLDN
jgi:hypothetical protein